MTTNAMTADDKLEVMELIGRYQQYVDAGDDEAYASNFTPDGIVESRGRIFRGREAIRAMVRDLVSNGRISKDGVVVRHFISMPYIHNGTSDRCSARTYMVTFGVDPDGDLIADTHWTYVDEIVKHEGRWLFARRQFQVDLRSRRDRTTTPQTVS
jgi:uncharacterized protein (TIGR02246 family)